MSASVGVADLRPFIGRSVTLTCARLAYAGRLLGLRRAATEGGMSAVLVDARGDEWHVPLADVLAISTTDGSGS